MAGGGTAGAQRRAWLTAALLSVALLVAPLLVWLFLPRPAPVMPARPEPAPAELSRPEPEVSAPKEAEVVAAAPPPEPPPPRETVVASAGPVRGVVLDPEGRPSAGAVVRCREPPGASASTDAEGRFELPPEADGCEATAEQAPFGDAEPTRVAAGGDNVLRLLAAGGIAGEVVDESGRPVEAYLLAIESFVPAGTADRGSVNGRARKVLDPAGAFQWGDLAPGRYVLAASAAGRPPARSPSVDVEAGRVTRGVRIVLPQGATLRGRVVDAASGEPVVEAQVELDSVTSSGANAISLVLTDANGDYELEGVPASGPFSVRVRHDAYVSKIVPGLDARGAGSARADIELRPLGDDGSREELTGIGAMLSVSPGGVVIADVVEGGPAALAGLARGDVIVRIDGESAADLPLSDCIQRLRGAPGTRVTVGVEREGRALDVTMRRDVVVR
ncbi:carboxyl-terminal processing protease [Sorangium cellulosum]|uniref:Carboxyl-terminal processing protease n=1 Tax=Sorangium cellulosum TaxID=56 RepID=A0A4P2QCD5_SORCE|nr:carboxypeptidase regulatory-like domain-containing protein [Sorangium cellulosum]AUX27309.1 carboxyl-terminal processing protease [Sorangium cellulosum]